MQNGISVVIPCLNEEASVGEVVRAALTGIAGLGLPGEVLVIDNGSDDKSAFVAKTAGAIVIAESRRGYGSATRKGFAAARYDILVMADADQTYDLTKLDDIVAPILANRADFVIGNRMNGIRHGAMPKLHRHIGNPVLSRLLRIMFSCGDVGDSQCGLRAIRKASYEKLSCMTVGMEFATEMIIKATQAGLTICEQPIEYHPRVGRSKLRPLQDGWRHLRFMLLYVPLAALISVPLLGWILTVIAMVIMTCGPVSIATYHLDIGGMIVFSMLNIACLQIMLGAVLARVYAHLNGFRRDSLVSWLYEHLRFRSGASLGFVLTGLGFVAIVIIVGLWLFRLLHTPVMKRLLILSLCSFVNGIQLYVSSYMVSIMALPRHIDHMPAEAENTAAADL